MKAVSILFLMAILAPMSPTTIAAETIEVVTESWLPYSYHLPDGSVGGVATDKVRRILDKTGYEYTISLYPWVRAYRTALSKKNVLIYSIYRTKAREQKFQWLCPFLPTSKLYVYALAERQDIKIQKLDDLKQYLLGISKDEFLYQHLLEQGFEDHRHLDLAPNYDTSLHKLAKQRIDLIISTDYLIDVRLKNLGFYNTQLRKVFALDTGFVADNCMALSLGTSASVVETVRAALVQVNRDKAGDSRPK